MPEQETNQKISLDAGKLGELLEVLDQVVKFEREDNGINEPPGPAEDWRDWLAEQLGKPNEPQDRLANYVSAALDVWFAGLANAGGDEYEAPEESWDQAELDRMHAALEAPTLDAALATFGVVLGDSTLSTPEQDAEIRGLMTELRQRFGRQMADAQGDQAPAIGRLNKLGTSAEDFKTGRQHSPASESVSENHSQLEAQRAARLHPPSHCGPTPHR